MEWSPCALSSYIFGIDFKITEQWVSHFYYFNEFVNFFNLLRLLSPGFHPCSQIASGIYQPSGNGHPGNWAHGNIPAWGCLPWDMCPLAPKLGLKASSRDWSERCWNCWRNCCCSRYSARCCSDPAETLPTITRYELMDGRSGRCQEQQWFQKE